MKKYLNKSILLEKIKSPFGECNCIKSHKPNEVTKKTIENVEKRKGLKKVATVEELFKKLGI